MPRKNKYPDEQILREAHYFLDKGESTYEVATYFKIPQSTAWWHLAVRLKSIDQSLAKEVKALLEKNWSGGGITRIRHHE